MWPSERAVGLKKREFKRRVGRSLICQIVRLYLRDYHLGLKFLLSAENGRNKKYGHVEEGKMRKNLLLKRGHFKNAGYAIF